MTDGRCAVFLLVVRDVERGEVYCKTTQSSCLADDNGALLTDSPAFKDAVRVLWDIKVG